MGRSVFLNFNNDKKQNKDSCHFSNNPEKKYVVNYIVNNLIR